MIEKSDRAYWQHCQDDELSLLFGIRHAYHSAFWFANFPRRGSVLCLPRTPVELCASIGARVHEQMMLRWITGIFASFVFMKKGDILLLSGSVLFWIPWVTQGLRKKRKR